MATATDGDQDDNLVSSPTHTIKAPSTPSRTQEASIDSDDEDDEEEGQDEEPKLKYSRLTGSLGAVYRAGDSSSAFLVAGDKMIIGTHNGNVNILTIPSFQPLRVYHAHSASVTAVSVSPFPPPWPSTRSESASRISLDIPTSSPAKDHSIRSGTPSSPRTPQRPQYQVPATPSNSIYIATASLDGHVCVQSLVDQKDVMLRNFARPVQAVALSPEYKSDRNYLSGGLAGNLILTNGGKSGVSANANTTSAAAAASGWLSSIGIGANTGRDTVIHSGEGSISAIKWSLSGKFVVWVNEQGIKIMRSDIRLDSEDADYAWKRIAHVDRPYRARWEEMAGVWKARVEWINESNLETDEEDMPHSNGAQSSASASDSLRIAKNGRHKRKKAEKLVVGWGDSAWVLQVTPETTLKSGERVGGSANIVHHLLFDDCIISGLSLYTPSLLLVLAYRTRDDNDNPIPSAVKTTPRRGVHHRQTGLSPELRLINAVTKEEVDVDTLTMSRFEGLSAADYHLGTLYVPAAPATGVVQRGALAALGDGLWDVSFGGAARIFTGSAASIRGSANSGGDMAIPGSVSGGKDLIATRRHSDAHPTASTPGLKIFIQSPFDCVLAVKRDLSDHLTWLLDHQEYKEAWELVDEHPEVITVSMDTASLSDSRSTTSTPMKDRRESLKDFFADDSGSTTTISASKQYNTALEKERRRIGELWLQQLFTAQDWRAAGRVAGRVLDTSPRWQHWILEFAKVGRIDEITPHVPSKPLHPPIESYIYELILGHYIGRDSSRVKELLDAWDTDLFKIGVITSALEDRLARGEVSEETVEGGEQGRDWRILVDSLARLYQADERPKDALRCYIRLQHADAAMHLIREYHLLSAISDDLPGFLLLRISKEQLQTAPLSELEEGSVEAVHLLVDEAYQGTVRPQVVVEQLDDQGPTLQPFLFFYLRALWKGQGTDAESESETKLKKRQRMEAEGRALLEDNAFGDLAVSLFAEYDRPLLMEFLRQSRSYAFEKASAICEHRQYWPELVYLLSQTGETKRALSLIINTLGDVSLAINFAKEQDDKDLWNDLLDYSMDKPRFIKGLLEEVGTTLDPITLVRRIPEGLEIEGLKEGIGKMVREYEIQASISDGVAKVLRGEVAVRMDALRRGRARGVKFEVVHEPEGKKEGLEVFVEPVVKPLVDGTDTYLAPPDEDIVKPHDHEGEVEPGHCAGCRKLFVEYERESLIGFACGHIYHLSCLLDAITDPDTIATAERLKKQLKTDEALEDAGFTRSVGAKVAHAHVLRSIVGEGCKVCTHDDGEEDTLDTVKR
ncbi:Vacuolar protein sorting-associated protein 41-like protein [Venturia nashicola]|uniref:Vacuolar protein sorting-associated protein 41-like protein n=1 Tax=Venturia nashicola TaxID=86259 RepID=A0A4Z1P3A4_9PEZI|nr:Vacuolar protein sorting-associated protein 41-like protein [Venturia nashicola]TLD20107.1 Vacuolar protein sorting-associated protein 41-like protein [Venturia nashicola]